MDALQHVFRRDGQTRLHDFAVALGQFEGLIRAKQMGIVLAEHFPKGSENPNELPDRLIEL